MRLRIALGIYLVIGAVSIVLGGIYLTAEQFMPYHSQAVGAPWRDLDPGTQALVLALMKVAGGGWLALGIFTIILGLGEFVRRSLLARWALPIATIVLYLASFWATWEVYMKTGASTPWAPSLVIVGLAMVAMMLDAPWSARSAQPVKSTADT